MKLTWTKPWPLSILILSKSESKYRSSPHWSDQPNITSPSTSSYSMSLSFKMPFSSFETRIGNSKSRCRLRDGKSKKKKKITVAGPIIAPSGMNDHHGVEFPSNSCILVARGKLGRPQCTTNLGDVRLVSAGITCGNKSPPWQAAAIRSGSIVHADQC